jgi:hypothetical protein
MHESKRQVTSFWIGFRKPIRVSKRRKWDSALANIFDITQQWRLREHGLDIDIDPMSTIVQSYRMHQKP